MSIREHQQSEIQEMFEEFKQTRFYQWLDLVIAGPYRWLVLPTTGMIDAFVLVIPTELVVSMYMMRNQMAIWWQQTTIVTFFASLGYGLLAWIVSRFGVDALGVLSGVIGGEAATSVDETFATYTILLAASAGVTSFFPMPATAFAVTVGLFDLSIISLMLGTFIGKFGRFGIFAYGAGRWGNDVVAYYFRHANIISLVVIVLLIAYIIF